MDYLIAPTLFQNKTCRLPGIGTLNIITASAESDFINSQIKAPLPSVVFIAELEDADVYNEFTALSELIKRDIDEVGSVTLIGIGDLVKGAESTISFLPQQLSQVFVPAVVAKRVVRQDAEHAILVGDKQTTNTVMTEYFVEDISAKLVYHWWAAAIILGIVGLAIVAYYISQNGFNLLGNAIGL